jgi:hypothetical protein
VLLIAIILAFDIKALSCESCNWIRSETEGHLTQEYPSGCTQEEKMKKTPDNNNMIMIFVDLVIN